MRAWGTPAAALHALLLAAAAAGRRPPPPPAAAAAVGVATTVKIAAGVPVLALNDSTTGTRAYFPHGLGWAGGDLILGVSTQSDDLYDDGMRGRLVGSRGGGAAWADIPQPPGQNWLLEGCCLPGGPQAGAAYGLSYALRRTSDPGVASAHGILLGRRGDGAGVLAQLGTANSSFAFGHPGWRPAGHPPCGCPQSPDDPCHGGKATPTQTLSMSGLGSSLVPAVRPLAGGGCGGLQLTTGYGFYERDAPSAAVAPPPSNLSIAVFAGAGQRWAWRSTAVHGPSLADRRCAGPSENGLLRLGDGRLLLVFRQQTEKTLCFTTASSSVAASCAADATQWAEPAPLHQPAGGRAPWGVAPQLHRLVSSDLIVLTAGRPGIMMWVAADSATAAAGGGWEPFNLAAHHNAALPNLQ